MMSMYICTGRIESAVVKALQESGKFIPWTHVAGGDAIIYFDKDVVFKDKWLPLHNGYGCEKKAVYCD